MKIEYVAEGSKDCPLIRLFGFDTREVSLLHDRVVGLADGSSTSFDTNLLPWVEAVGGCHLIFEVTKRDEGITHYAANLFRYRLTAETWDNVAGLMEPFLTDVAPNRYQWLDQTIGIRLLLSPDGLW